jgi:hypothetical protein
MKFLARLATGDIALWRTFWLIGMPLALVWDASLGCMVLAGFGAQEPFIAGVVIALFALSSAALPFVSVAIWRSSSKYPRDAWWHTVLAWSAKLSAAFSGLTGALSVLGLLYLAFSFIYAAIADA